MAHLALIDDDPTEALVLEGMLEHAQPSHQMTHFLRVEDFPGAPANDRFDLILLDRRIPPHDGFDTSLQVLAATRFSGVVVPISAGNFYEAPKIEGLRICPPILKLDLLTPEAVATVISQALALD